jgi:hypothetical protein
MSENGTTFADGFINGWKSIMGAVAAIPGIPAHAIPAGTTPYLHGIAKGVAAAMERKTASEKSAKKS